MNDVNRTAADFVRALASGEAGLAHEMLSEALRQATTALNLSEQYALLAEDMGGVTGIGEPMVILEEWPDMSANDRAMVYVPLEGDVFSEAITVTVSAADEGLCISNIEWGRPRRFVGVQNGRAFSRTRGLQILYRQRQTKRPAHGGPFLIWHSLGD